MWESRRDFQGLWKRWETCFWFSTVSISAVTFHNRHGLLKFFRRCIAQSGMQTLPVIDFFQKFADAVARVVQILLATPFDFLFF